MRYAQVSKKMNPPAMEKPSGYGILAIICMILILIFLIRQFTGHNSVSSTPFEEMRAVVLDKADLTVMQEAEGSMVKRLYGLDPSEYEGLTLYYPTSNMGAEELLLVKLKDPSQQQAVKEAVEARLNTQKNSFEGYGVDQFEMLEKSIVDIRGNYVLFVVQQDPSVVQAAFDSAY